MIVLKILMSPQKFFSALIAVVLSAVPFAVFAQEAADGKGSATNAVPAAATPKAKEPKAPKEANAFKGASGKVQFVSETSISLKTKKNADFTFTITPDTKFIKPDGTAGAFSDIALDSNVRVEAGAPEGPAKRVTIIVPKDKGEKMQAKADREAQSEGKKKKKANQEQGGSNAGSN